MMRQKEGCRRVRQAVRWLATGAACLLWLGVGTALAAGSVEVEDRTGRLPRNSAGVVCQNLSVADSPSDLAKEMRNLVREQVQQGKSREEIQAYFVSRYGEYVLLSPPSVDSIYWSGGCRSWPSWRAAASSTWWPAAGLSKRRPAGRQRIRPTRSGCGAS